MSFFLYLGIRRKVLTLITDSSLDYQSMGWWIDGWLHEAILTFIICSFLACWLSSVSGVDT